MNSKALKAFQKKTLKSLYAPKFEKDACGVALIANMKGIASHETVLDATTILARMEHRGGCGCEPNTGDGAGILVGMPDSFMRKIGKEVGITLPKKGAYASGLVFLSHDQAIRNAQMEAMSKAADKLQLKVLGWRKPVTDNSPLGATALASEPYINQVFVTTSNNENVDPLKFERSLYLLRKSTSQSLSEESRMDFYVASLSSRTITYKGQLTSYQLPMYYRDLVDPSFQSHMAMVHSRFSTNTFPSWDRAQPNRMLCHNGEINTLRGNKNWVTARMKDFQVPFLSTKTALEPYTSDLKTDSGNLDSVLELLVLGSEERTLPEAMMMMVPEAWQNDTLINKTKKAFYEYHSCMMEPWDGPAMMAFTDGRYMGAILDRNGLRPSRYYVTTDERVLLSSEVGVLPELPISLIKHKGRLEPGKMFLVDFEKGGLIHDEELKSSVTSKRPYEKWVRENLHDLREWSSSRGSVTRAQSDDAKQLKQKLKTFGYTQETLDILLQPMASVGKEALGSMGVDIPLAVLSEQPQLPFNYMKQLFAQVTNPPIDPIREEIVMSLACPVGPEKNVFLAPTPDHSSRLIVPHPILSREEMAAISSATNPTTAWKGRWFSRTVAATFSVREKNLAESIDRVCAEAARAVREDKAPIVVLSHLSVDAEHAPIPSLLVTGAVHHHLIQEGLRTRCALVVESGDAREVHDFCTLVGFGADAVHPFVAMAAIESMFDANQLGSPYCKSKADALDNYRHAAGKGMLKVMAKMGISTLQSYKGAQIFECVGLHEEVVSKCFPGTASRISGAGFDVLTRDVLKMHDSARGGTEFCPTPGITTSATTRRCTTTPQST